MFWQECVRTRRECPLPALDRLRVRGVARTGASSRVVSLDNNANVSESFYDETAQATRGTVVTLEGEPRNGAKIPNICRHFRIPCVSLEGFMEEENWTF